MNTMNRDEYARQQIIKLHIMSVVRRRFDNRHRSQPGLSHRNLTETLAQRLKEHCQHE